MSVTVEISPNVLAWIGQQILPKVDTQISSLLNRWINKEESPNINTIRQVSRSTHIPFGYFFLKNPPQEECSLIHCRTINSKIIRTLSRDFIDVYNTMLNLQEWMSDYRHKYLGLSPLSFVGSYSDTNATASIANDIRMKMNLPIDFFKHVKKDAYFNFLRNKISDLGILVMKNSVVGNDNHRKLNLEEFRAFTLIDSYAPLIFLNSNDSKNGQIFSLIHELAHIWIGINNLFNDNYFNANVSKIEQICNLIAAEFLAPVSILKSEWDNLKGYVSVKIAELADIFHCSELVIARRALDLKFITQPVYDDVVLQTKKHLTVLQQTDRPKTGGNFNNTLKSKWDKNLILALNSSTKEGNTSYLDAYRLTGLKGDTFHKLVMSFNKK